MHIISKILIGLVALIHSYILVLEMFLWESRGPKVFTSFRRLSRRLLWVFNLNTLCPAERLRTSQYGGSVHYDHEDAHRFRRRDRARQ